MGEILKIAVCDDEKNVLEEHAKTVEEVLREKNMEYFLKCFEKPEELLKSENAFDIVILDVKMNDTNGIETAKKLKAKDKNCMIFFVTNYETYLDEAFDIHAFRFWTKPIDKKRLSLAIDSAKREIEKNEKFILVTKGTNKVRVMIESIIYINSVMKKTVIATKKGTLEVSDSFSELSKKLLHSADFFETHRGYCVNFRYVTNYDKTKVFCQVDGTTHEVYLSRRKYTSFCKSFMEWMGSINEN